MREVQRMQELRASRPSHSADVPFAPRDIGSPAFWPRPSGDARLPAVYVRSDAAGQRFGLGRAWLLVEPEAQTAADCDQP
jgi:hypothetical protein